MSKFNLITYEKAKEEMQHLQKYIHLIENYNITNIEGFIIKNYAITNSSSSVIKLFNSDRQELNCPNLSRDFIFEVIKSPPKDELHKIIRSAYIKKYTKRGKKSPK